MAKLPGNLDDILTGHHTEARVYRSYEDALSAAQGLGITAKPLRNLSKPGWVVLVPWKGEPYYYRGGMRRNTGKRARTKQKKRRSQNPLYLEAGRGGKRGQQGFGIGFGYRRRENPRQNPLLGIFGGNPKVKIVRELGRVVEVRYKRKDDGGLYYHKYASKPRLLALSDGSIWIKGA